MSSSTRRREFVQCTDTNGSRSIDWITNKFARYQTQPVKLLEGEDPCNLTASRLDEINEGKGDKIKYYKHQNFVGEKNN